MKNNETVQYQMRTRTLTTEDYLHELPCLINTSDLSPQQRNVLEAYNQYTDLLNDLWRKKWELEKNNIIASVKKLQVDSFQRQITAVRSEREFFEKEQSVLINELLVIARFRFAEEERKKLEEWRKTRHSSRKSNQ